MLGIANYKQIIMAYRRKLKMINITFGGGYDGYREWYYTFCENHLPVLRDRTLIH